MNQESPGCLGWTVRALAVILILIGGVFLWSIRPVETAGNTGIWFLLDLGTHAQADPEEAYDRLCAAEKARLDRAQFTASDFGEYSALAARGAVGAETQYPELDTLNRDIQAAWVEHEVQDGDIIETWRLNLVRERKWWDWRGDWKICGIEFRNERPADG